MYCHKCGYKLPDGSNFCNNCGTALNGNESANYLQAHSSRSIEDEKKQLMVNIKGSFSVMSAIKEQEIKIQRYSHKAGKAGKYCRFRCFFFFSLIGFFTGYIYGASRAKLDSSFNWIRFFLCVWIGSIIFGILFVSFFNRIKKKNLKKCNEETEVLEQLKSDVALSWLPYDYRDSESFAYIYLYIRNLRAHTLTEAINLYETEKHQHRLEQINHMVAKYTAEAARAANRAATDASDVAFFMLFK